MTLFKPSSRSRQRTYELKIEDVTILVTKKKMKNMYLRIRKEDGSVLISAPLQMSDAHIRRFATERIDWIRTYQQKYATAKQHRVEDIPPSLEELKQQKQSLKTEVEKLVRKWEPIIGVKVSGITIRKMKTRWGSCNVKTHHININLALAKKPPECLEYVVVHEMTHILEPSHNQDYWAYMTKFYPNWKRVRKYLNDEVVE